MKKIELQPLSDQHKANIVRSALSSSPASKTANQERVNRDMNLMLNHAFRVAKESAK